MQKLKFNPLIVGVLTVLVGFIINGVLATNSQESVHASSFDYYYIYQMEKQEQKQKEIEKQQQKQIKNQQDRDKINQINRNTISDNADVLSKNVYEQIYQQVRYGYQNKLNKYVSIMTFKNISSEDLENIVNKRLDEISNTDAGVSRIWIIYNQEQGKGKVNIYPKAELQGIMSQQEFDKLVQTNQKYLNSKDKSLISIGLQNIEQQVNKKYQDTLVLNQTSKKMGTMYTKQDQQHKEQYQNKSIKYTIIGMIVFSVIIFILIMHGIKKGHKDLEKKLKQEEQKENKK